MKRCPCKDCTRRKLLCHSTCTAYKEWKTWHEENKEQKVDVVNMRAIRQYWRELRYDRQARGRGKGERNE